MCEWVVCLFKGEGLLLGMQGKGTLRPIKGSTQTHEEGFYKGMAHYLIWEVGVHKW